MLNYYSNHNLVNHIIVSYACGDVTGDGIPDNVYLMGMKSPSSPFVTNITLVIQNGFTGKFNSIQLSENAGYDPNVFLVNFTGHRGKDILISINSGGSGGIMYHYIYSFINNIPKLLFDFNIYNEEYKYDVVYKDNYKVEVISKKNNLKYIIDISMKDQDYLDEIYDENGKLKAPITGFVNPLSGLYPVDFDSNKIYELLAYQKIAGRYNADSLGYIQNTLKWENTSFVLNNQYLAIFGSDL